jgi:hypothetical protein
LHQFLKTSYAALVGASIEKNQVLSTRKARTEAELTAGHYAAFKKTFA